MQKAPTAIITISPSINDFGKMTEEQREAFFKMIEMVGKLLIDENTLRKASED